MCRRLPRLLCAVLVVACTAPAWSFIQERTPGGLPFRWNLVAAQPNVVGGKIVYIINKRGSDDVDFASLATGVDSAFAAWRLANGSVVDFIRNTDPSTAPEGTSPNRADRRNTVYWDEDPRNGSHLPSLVVGLTIRDVNIATGEILDADLVLNAAQFRWTIKNEDNFTTLTGPADVQESIARAVGQLLGLNNVPTRGSVMQAYTYPGSRGRISLAADDLAAALDIYPPTPNPAVTSISGQVTKAGSPVFGAYVVAFQNGQPVVGAVTSTAGTYSIRRLPMASPTYVVRVLTARPPFDTTSFYNATDSNFLSLVNLNSSMDPPVSGQVTVTPGADSPGINFAVVAAGTADPWEPDDSIGTATTIPVGVRQIHHTHSAGNVDFVKFVPIAGRAYLIETDNLGMGAVESDTSIALVTGEPGCPCFNDDRDSKQKSKTSRFPFVATGAIDHVIQIAQSNPTSGGSGTAYDILITDLGATPLPVPSVSAVTPSEGPQAGGYQVTIIGTNFLPGASVLFGAISGTEVDVVNSTTLFVTVPAAAAGAAVNVTVANMGGGASAPLVSGFTYIGEITVFFSDETFNALASLPGEGRTVAWVDYDLDGDLDLYFTNSPAGPLVPNNLYRNNGDGTFTDVTAASLITVSGVRNWVSATWGDFDNDGCPDVYLVNLIVAAERFLLRNTCSGTFQNVTASAGVAGRSNGRSRDAAWADYDNDGFLDLFIAYDDLAGPNQLFRNQGNGQFVDVAAIAGVNNTGSGFNANWADFDNDGWMDLFVVRSGTMSDILYRNNANGTFTDVTAAMGIIDTAQGRDAVWGDLNNDGFMDLYVVGATGINHVFLNNAGTGFTDASSPPTFANAGFTNGASQGAAVADIDNDGDLDLAVVQSLLTGGTREDLLFQNNGGSPPTFTAFTFGDNVDANAAAFGDYSGDGTPDLFVGGVGAQSDFLWLNGANRNNWMVVRLIGSTSNRMGVGARVQVTADLDGDGGAPPVTQMKQVLAGSKGQGPIEVAFGLGRASVEQRRVDNLTVIWPRSGITQTFTDLATDQIIKVQEGPLSLVVSRITPSSGTTAGGTVVVISGDNFDSDAIVTFDGISATVTPPVSTRSITVTTPGHGVGLADVTVTNPSRAPGDPLRQGTLPKGYLYFSGDPVDSLMIYDSVNTTATWASIPGALAYDVIRGNLASVVESGGQISLGTVVCIENDSTDTTTAPNHRDSATPALGTGFFYLLRVSGGTYGVGSSGAPRVPTSGDCP